jgi:MIP family channel proteins
MFDAPAMTPPRPRRVMPAHPPLSDAGAMIEEKGPAAYLAEFVGTLVLVLAITGFVSASVFATRLDLLGLGIVHGLALMGIVYTIGSISGAHVNPAVTLALVAIRKITGRDAGFYIFAQVLGGIVGAWLAKEFFLGRGSLVNYGTPGLNDTMLQGGSVWLGFLAEAIGAFLIVWAVMGTAVNPNAPKGVAGAAIGGALALGVLIFGPATGASFNPARWFGPSLVSGQWNDPLLYIFAPIVGALVAAFLYLSVMRLEPAPLPAQTPRRGESAEPPVAA